MSWHDEIMSMFAVGDVKTVPEICEKLVLTHPHYMASTLRAKAYAVLNTATKYGIVEKVGTVGQCVMWRRLI